MKKIYLLLMLIGVLTIGITSCEKEDVTPPSQQQPVVNDTTNTTNTTNSDTIIAEWYLGDGTHIKFNYNQIMMYRIDSSSYNDNTKFYFADGESLDLTSHSDTGVWINSFSTSTMDFLNKINGAKIWSSGPTYFEFLWDLTAIKTNNDIIKYSVAPRTANSHPVSCHRDSTVELFMFNTLFTDCSTFDEFDSLMLSNDPDNQQSMEIRRANAVNVNSIWQIIN